MSDSDNTKENKPPTLKQNPVAQSPVLVRFNKSWTLYNAGETAGFPAEKANWLIKHKIASHVKQAEES